MYSAQCCLLAVEKQSSSSKKSGEEELAWSIVAMEAPQISHFLITLLHAKLPTKLLPTQVGLKEKFSTKQSKKQDFMFLTFFKIHRVEKSRS